jgi:hypothetical protein
LLPRAASSGTLLQCFVFFTQNIHWRLHILADTMAPFLTIWHFSQNCVMTEVLICPIYILNELLYWKKL